MKKNSIFAASYLGVASVWLGGHFGPGFATGAFSVNYYVKYGWVRPGSSGTYSNTNVAEKPYMFSVMQTKSQWSSNTYMPYLKEADEQHLSRDSMGQRLVYGDRHIICQNGAFALRDNETEEILETIPIQQNEDGIDVENRIEVLKRFIVKVTTEQPEAQTE